MMISLQLIIDTVGTCITNERERERLNEKNTHKTYMMTERWEKYCDTVASVLFHKTLFVLVLWNAIVMKTSKSLLLWEIFLSFSLVLFLEIKRNALRLYKYLSLLHQPSDHCKQIRIWELLISSFWQRERQKG